jgi:hypothetical protein
MTKTELVHINRDTILQRLAQGELVSTIARDLGCSRQLISNELAQDVQYQQAFFEALDARLDKADEAIEQAQDTLSLARAREQASMARWRAERLNSARYGQRPSVAIQVNTGSAITDAELAKIVREGG